MPEESRVDATGECAPARGETSGKRAMRIAGWALLLLGAVYCESRVARAKPDPMPLVFTFFVIALFLRPYGTAAVPQTRLHPAVKFVFLVILSGWRAECLAWLSNYIIRDPEPALLHPQLIAVDRVLPNFRERGRYVPALDHTIPPNVTMDSFWYCLECGRSYE
jgi:hypothetical protein